jgi:hypothetical protein
MFHLASTRFNNTTFNENKLFKNKNKIDGVIYGSNLRIKENYDKGVLLFIFEMNNETNKIEGVGIVRNNLVSDKKYNIYSNMDYNRYIYKGEYYLSREEIVRLNEDYITKIENILFKGKSHLKRQSGISILTEKLLCNWNYQLDEFKQIIKNIFILRFKNIENDINNENTNLKIQV